MSMWTAFMVIAIVAIAVSGVVRIVQAKHGTDPFGHRQDKGDPGANQSIVNANAELQRELESLRERIKVLERIATEDRKSLAIAKEIEDLRGN